MSDESEAAIEAWLTEQRDTFDRWTPQRDTINLLLHRLRGETRRVVFRCKFCGLAEGDEPCDDYPQVQPPCGAHGVVREVGS